MRLIPAFDRVVILLQDKEQVSPGGIVLPEVAQDKPSIGVIESIGPGAYNDHGVFVATTFKPGQRIMFGKWAGQEYPGDKTRFILREGEIMGTVTD